MTELTRRKVLLSTAAIGAAGLAGCVGDSDSDGNGDAAGNGNGSGNDTDDDGTENGTDSTENNGIDHPDVALETVGAGCAEGDSDSVEIESDNESITVTGITPAPTQCHEAVLQEATFEESSFTLVIDVRDVSGEEMCAQCTGELEYEASLTPENAADISEGTVRHVRGGTHAVAWDSVTEDPEQELAVTDARIETVDSDCLGATTEGRGSLSVRDGGVTVDGAVQAPNPCHEAVLAGTSLADDRLSVDVDIAPAGDGDEMCIDCVGEVLYSVEVDLTNVRALQGVTVTSPDGNRTEYDTDPATQA
jgi:hypothetical protein